MNSRKKNDLFVTALKRMTVSINFIKHRFQKYYSCVPEFQI